jgi:hypothetical protein
MRKEIIQSAIIFFYFLFYLTYALQNDIEITVHNRVDTTRKEVNITLWKNYLSSKPDSIYNNPYWNGSEKKKYKDFDFTRQFIYIVPSEKILNFYIPTILSVTKIYGC